jgi:inosine-uridine nucleoside N-ribohydrolase
MKDPQMTFPRQPILIDTETVFDDAVALIVALRSTKVEVRALRIDFGLMGEARGRQRRS